MRRIPRPMIFVRVRCGGPLEIADTFLCSKIVADLSLDNAMLQDVIRRKL